MRCPQDGDVELVTERRHGIEVDFCPRCRGMWLDRAALDAIVERTAAEEAAVPTGGAGPAAGHAAGHVSGEGGQGLGPDPGLGRDRGRAASARPWLADVLDVG